MNDDWPPIVANQNLTEGGIFYEWWLIPPNFYQPETHWKF